MNAPTSFRYRPGPRTALVGAVGAVAVAGLMAGVAGTATAGPPARCIENVNVRAEPHPGAPIIAVCPAGAKTRLGPTRDGYVELTDLGGWAALQYVATGAGGRVEPALHSPGRNVALTPAPAIDSRG
jgi:uncharacterized protein YraI